MIVEHSVVAVGENEIERKSFCAEEDVGSPILQVAGLAAVFGLTSLVYFSFIDSTFSWGDDFAGYLLQARSLVFGSIADERAVNRFTILGSTIALGPVTYPWGTPLLLAPLLAGSELNFALLKVPMVVSFLIFLWAYHSWLRPRHSPVVALMLTAFFAFNPQFLKFSAEILSDLPFLALVMLVLLAIDHLVARPQRIESKTFGVYTGLLVAAAVSVRLNGIVLFVVVAVGQWVALRRRDVDGWSALLRGRFAAVFLPYVTALSSLIALEAALPGDYAVHSHLLRAPSLAAIEYYLNCLPGFFLAIPAADLLVLALMPLTLWGLASSSRRDLPGVMWVFGTLVIYASWQLDQGARFIFPVLPVLASAALRGAEALFQRVPLVLSRGARVTFNVIFLFVIMLLLRADLSVFEDQVEARSRPPIDVPYAPEGIAALAAVRSHVPEDKVVVFFKPRLMRLLTGRRGLAIDDPARIRDGDYLLMFYPYGPVGQITRTQIATLRSAGILEERFRSAQGSYELFQVIRQ